ncbi:sterile alpha motif domain-containing protein 14 isoform X3 [Passer domesticus]|uniref:sterile alpha motif domain-containing protein 14 isoform X3 n=1 Tax=Passer domesticus TaxID=48849 RepID=UPI0030FE5F8D
MGTVWGGHWEGLEGTGGDGRGGGGHWEEPLGTLGSLWHRRARVPPVAVPSAPPVSLGARRAPGAPGAVRSAPRPCPLSPRCPPGVRSPPGSFRAGQTPPPPPPPFPGSCAPPAAPGPAGRLGSALRSHRPRRRPGPATGPAGGERGPSGCPRSAETPRLDSSLHKARARLLARGRRQRPSRSRLRDSASSTEGDEGPEATGTEGEGSPPAPSPFSRTDGFSFEPGVARPGLGDPPAPTPPLSRYRPLTNTPSQEGLSGPPAPQSSSDSSPGFARRDPRPRQHSEDDSRDMSPPSPASPTVGLDKKTRRKFLDLGVTLRRASSAKSRKEKSSNRLSVGSREAAEGPGRPSGSPFLPFSWFSDSARGSGSPGPASPAGSPRHEGLSPAKSASQDSELSEDSPPSSTSPRLPGPPRCSYPYHTLSQSSDELLEEPAGAAAGWTCGQVGQWLQSLGLERYVRDFAERGVDGPRLLLLDGAKLKALGVGSSQDRAVLKRRLKELSLAAERQRKARDKAEKQREKQRKKEQEQRRS